MEDDEPVVEVIGIYDDDGRSYKANEIDMPPLCQTCV